MADGEPTSKRGRVRVCFETKGEAKAAALGASLGVGAGRLKRWFKLWSGETTPTRREPTVSQPTPKPRPRNTKGMIRLTWLDGVWGKVIEKTDATTTIMWPNGNVNTVPNDWVLKEGE